jgi:hypothetical protein
MTRKLNFADEKYAYKYQLQDKKERVEQRNEVFNKFTVTPHAPNGEILRFNLETFVFQIQRQALYGVMDEYLRHTFNPLAFPYHWNDSRVIGEWGYLATSLLDTSQHSTYIENLQVGEDEFVSLNVNNPFVRHPDTKVKTVRVTGDFAKIVKVTGTIYQGWNDMSHDEETNLPNASLKLYYRQKLAEGAVLEFYPVVKARKRDDGSVWLGDRLQRATQKMYEWMSEIEAGTLDKETAAAQYYAAKALRSQAYKTYDAAKATGALTEKIEGAVNLASRQFAMGEKIEEFGDTIKLEGSVVDVSQVPVGVYSASVNGRKRYFDTRLRVDRYNLLMAAQQHNSSIDLTREADDFTF